MTVVTKEGNLVITIPLLPKPAASKSGKTLIVASTNGFFASDCKVAGHAVRVSVNAIISKD